MRENAFLKEKKENERKENAKITEKQGVIEKIDSFIYK